MCFLSIYYVTEKSEERGNHMTITINKKPITEGMKKPSFEKWRERIMFNAPHMKNMAYIDTEQRETIRENKFKEKLRRN